MSDLAQKWNPLEDGPMEEIVPSHWIGSHAGKRLADAYRTLAIVPMKSIGAGSSFWPDYARDEMPKLEDGEQPRKVQRATPAEISRMEEAIGWAARYLRDDADDAPRRIVQIVAIATAFGRDLDQVCKRRRWYMPTVLRKNRRGLQLIAEGLNRDGVVPW
ncbi:hypothetical protein KQX64_06975 [Rhodopseudomonas palustris]|nr:hypothetical protein KQX64_06975 [Rhodopseudomonas palustris]